MDAAAKARLKDEVFGRYLQVLNLDGDRKGDQLTAELRHFVDCVRTGRTPRVTRRGRPRRAGTGRARAGGACGVTRGRAGRTARSARRDAEAGRAGCSSRPQRRREAA